MKIAVIGATGFIGRHLCDTHLGRGDAVTALVRDPAAADALARKGISVVLGDLSDEESLRRVCADADAVFNVSGALGRWGMPVEELERVNVQGAERVVRCAAKAGAARVVHTSTAGVSGPLPAEVFASEDYPPSPATEYQRTKLAGEQAALKAHVDTGIPLVIVRPAFVYGPGDAHKLSLFRTVAARRMILVNGGMSRLHPVFVDDVAHGIICASERAPGNGEIYILAGPNPVSTRKLVETIAWALAVPSPKISLPESLLLPLARTMEITARIVRKEPSLTRSRVKLLSEDYAYSIEKARRELGFKPVVDLPEGVRLTVEWYLSRGLLGKVKHGREHAA